MLCILTEILSCARAERAKSLNDFKFGTAIGRFPSDGAVSMAVKGLTLAITTLAEQRLFHRLVAFNPTS